VRAPLSHLRSLLPHLPSPLPQPPLIPNPSTTHTTNTHLLHTGIKAKVENKGQYDEYLRELKPLREELGVSLKEDLYPEP